MGANRWFRSYFSGRFQCVSVNGFEGSYAQNSCGVPQDSVLGALVFLLLETYDYLRMIRHYYILNVIGIWKNADLTSVADEKQIEIECFEV
jgi:hypothetical protein